VTRRVLIYWAPAAAYAVLILFLSTVRMPESMPEIWQIDKLYHFTAYLVMGAVFARAVRGGAVAAGAGRRWRLGGTVAAGAAMTFVFGVFIETVQIFIPERSADAIDAAVNGAAGLMGAALYSMLRKRV
jgi:VanZ family protein